MATISSAADAARVLWKLQEPGVLASLLTPGYLLTPLRDDLVETTSISTELIWAAVGTDALV
jgi:hypothetical protein